MMLHVYDMKAECKSICSVINHFFLQYITEQKRLLNILKGWSNTQALLLLLRDKRLFTRKAYVLYKLKSMNIIKEFDIQNFNNLLRITLSI